MDKLEDCPVISSVRSKGQEAVQFEISRARNYFSKPDVVDAVNKQAQETLAWMRDNKQSYSATGDLRQSEPWWPVPSETSRRILKRTRERVLWDRAYEHGILHFLRRLEEIGVVGKLVDRVIDTLVGSMTPVVLNQLIARRHTPEVNDGVSLSELSALFGNGKGTSATKVRDKYLGDLAATGLFCGRENQGYNISIGIVGEVFFNDVFDQILDEMDVNYKQTRKLAA